LFPYGPFQKLRLLWGEPVRCDLITAGKYYRAEDDIPAADLPDFAAKYAMADDGNGGVSSGTVVPEAPGGIATCFDIRGKALCQAWDGVQVFRFGGGDSRRADLRTPRLAA
jgi:hypothetical protein